MPLNQGFQNRFLVTTVSHQALEMWFVLYLLIEPSREKTNIVDSALSIDPDQPKHALEACPDRHFSSPVDFLFQESLLYTSIPPETEYVGPDQSARSAQADLGRYITQRPYCFND